MLLLIVTQAMGIGGTLIFAFMICYVIWRKI